MVNSGRTTQSSAVLVLEETWVELTVGTRVLVASGAQAASKAAALPIPNIFNTSFRLKI